MSRSFLFAKEIDSEIQQAASDHVAVLAALDYSREERHDRSTADMFAALIQSYWRDLSLAERRVIARVLAPRSDVPRVLITLFLSDHYTVANAIIDASPLIDEPDYYRIAETRVMPMLRVLARRTLPTDLVPVLARLRDTSTALALALNRGILPDAETLACLLDTAGNSKHVARALALRDDLPMHALMHLFPELDSSERLRVIDQVERETLVSVDANSGRSPVGLLTENQRASFIDIAKRAGRSAFVDQLADQVPVGRRYFDAMLQKDTGEIQVILLAGLGFSATEATTLFIIIGAEDALSYEEVKTLTELFERVQRRIAGRFLAVWSGKRTETDLTRADSLQERGDTRRAGSLHLGSAQKAPQAGALKVRRPKSGREG